MSSSLLEEPLPERPVPEPVSSAPDTVIHSALVHEVFTELVVTRYSDRLFLAVTQLGKLGTILEARREKVQEGAVQGAGAGRTVYSVAVLLGQEREEVTLLARILAEKLQLTQPLVLCVGVKDISAQTVRGLVDFILSKVI